MVGSDCTREKGDEKNVLFSSSIVHPRITIWTLKQFSLKGFLLYKSNHKADKLYGHFRVSNTLTFKLGLKVR